LGFFRGRRQNDFEQARAQELERADREHCRGSGPSADSQTAHHGLAADAIADPKRPP
jgi:hypothetical protein